MPTSTQSAASASARLSVVGSDGDREPARDNVFPCDVDDDRRASPRAQRLHRNAGCVDRDELTLDNTLGFTAPVADVHPPAVEAVVILSVPQWTFGARRGDLEVVWAIDEIRMVEQGTGHAAHALAVFDGDRL